MVLAAGELTPGAVAKEATATLKALLHYIEIQEARQTFNKDSFCSASYDVLSQLGRLDSLSMQERQICEESKARLLNRHVMPSPFDPQALLSNVVNAPSQDEDE